MAPVAIANPKVNDSRRSILDAAEHIIAQRGYGGLSMRALSQQSGLAKSTLYHYFQDKHDIYLSVLERDIQLFVYVLDKASKQGQNSRERLHSLVRTYIEHVHEHGSIAMLVLRRAGEFDKHVLEMFGRHRNGLVAPFASVLAEGSAEGMFQPLDVDMTVISLLGMMNGFAAHRLLFECGTTDFYAEVDTIIEQIMSVFLTGILKEQKQP